MHGMMRRRALPRSLRTHLAPRRHVRDKPRLGDTLEIIKYICKEFWPFVFKKGIDNLRTNHRVRRFAFGRRGRRPGARSR